VLPKEKELDPRARRTRQLLLEAFGELLQEKRVQSITVQDIAERATVNRATFYAHFDDKYALMDGFIRQGFEQWLESRFPVSSTFSLGNLRLLIVTVLDYLVRLHEHCGPYDKDIGPQFAMTVQDELYRFILAWLKKTPAAEGPRRETPETTAMVMSWAIFGAGAQWSMGVKTLSAEEMASQVAAVLTRGLAQNGKPRLLERPEQKRDEGKLAVPHGDRVPVA
jgi:AcrR family transcriptional regulator